MAEHIQEYLGAYLDGELHGWRLQQVEKHLAECQACDAELAELRSLSASLQATPMEGNFTPAERFAAQVLLQLPRQQKRPLGIQPAKIGWWLAPAAILSAWVFTQTVVIVSWLVWAGGQTGLFGTSHAWLAGAPLESLWVGTALSLFNGSLAGSQPTLSLAVNWGQSFLIYSIWLAVLAALLWTWLAVWWFRRQQLTDPKIV
jgi:anti-sigma factor RsiW